MTPVLRTLRLPLPLPVPVPLPFLVLGLALLAGPAAGRSPDPVNNPTIDFEAPEREQVGPEAPSTLPAIPPDHALHAFEAGATSPNSFGVDPVSLLVRGDSIVQFTLVVTSPRGVRNISYEALDCERAQVRLMAIGRDGQGWSPAQSANWRPVRNGDTVNAHYRELYRNWCDGGLVAAAPPQLLRRLGSLPQRYQY
jgi:hypothetical protein